MPHQYETVSITTIDLVGQAIAAADGTEFQVDPARYRRLALAALGPLETPTEAMVDAANEAASFDPHWAVNSRRDYKRAVKAIIAQAQGECGIRACRSPGPPCCRRQAARRRRGRELRPAHEGASGARDRRLGGRSPGRAACRRRN